MQRNPIFAALCKKLHNTAVPKWKQGGDELAKVNAWIHKSGFVQGIDFVLEHLGYEHDS